ncbi:MAG: AAA family ATPase [Ferruginibacter sp.]
MISIKRTAPDPGTFLNDPATQKLQSDLSKFYSRSKTPNFAQSRFDFEKIRYHLYKALSGELKKDFNSKCCYCESKILKDSPENIEHFRPNFSAEGFVKKDFAPLHYWWLTFEWGNIYYACQECRRYKGQWFPVLNQRAPPGASMEIVKKERNVIIDPCNDINVEWKFGYYPDGRVFSAPTRTRQTIDILNLNRPGLLKNRKKHYEKFKEEFDGWVGFFTRPGKLGEFERTDFFFRTDRLNAVLFGVSPDEYLGIKQYFFFKWITDDKHKEILNFIISEAVPKKFYFAGEKLVALFTYINTTRNRITANRKQFEKIKSLGKKETVHVVRKEYYIKSIEIKNFKSITSLKYDIPPNASRTSWLMLLGENGVGKSSSLQAIALALTDPAYQKEILERTPSSYLKHNTRSGSIKIDFEGEQKPVRVDFTASSVRRSAPEGFRFPATTLLGYGSTRLLPDPALKWEKDFIGSDPDIQGRVRNLFVPSCALYNSEEWLLEIYKANRQDFNFAALAIKSLIDFDTEIDLYDKTRKSKSKKSGLLLVRAKDEQNKYRVYVQRNEHRYLLSELSDGYQSVIALCVDIMRSLFKLNTDMNNANAIVLVDEIGTHLHPRWRMRVVNSLRRAFPKVQFIVTTHDPLCLKGMYDKEVAVLRLDNENNIQAITNLPDPNSFRADQLLTSEFFGLSSTLDPDTEKIFNRYYYLKALPDVKRKKMEAEPNEMERLEAKIRIQQADSTHLGDSLREEIVYHVIDELLAKNLRKAKPVSRKELKSAAVKRVQDLWNKIEKGNS